MADGREPLNRGPRSYLGSLKVDKAALDQDGIDIASLVTLARGNLLVGNASGKAAPLNAKTSGQILVGNGTDLLSVPVSGDATLSAAGVLTVGPGAITAAKADANITTARRTVAQGTITTTAGGEVLLMAPCSGNIVAVRFVAKDALATNNTNNIAFGLLNKTQTLTVVDSTAAVNTTQTTGGSALVAYTARVLTLTANIAVTANDVLALSVVVANTLANQVTEGIWQVTFSPS